MSLGHECLTEGQGETTHAANIPNPPQPGKARVLTQASGLELRLAFMCSQLVSPGCDHGGLIGAHPVLCKCTTARSGRIQKGGEGVFHQESLFLLGCLCLCVSFSVCVGGRHLSPSSLVFLPHFAWAPVPFCLGFRFLSLL